MHAVTPRSAVRTLCVLPVVLACLAAMSGCADAAHKPALLLSLPDSCNTPDGMTLDEKSGDVILACPNFNDPDHKSRLIRVRIENGKPVGADVAVDGFKLSNAVIWHGNHVYVSDTHFDLKDKPGMSGIYRFSLAELNQGTVQLKPKSETDPHLIATFQTIPGRGNSLAGADGLTFDGKGNLYTGNFGDGVFYKISFNADGSVQSNRAHLLHPRLTCVDGIFCDLKTDRIYIADSEKNAIQVVETNGNLTTLWENDDNDGSGGLLDQPCEVLIRGDDLIIVNMDMPFPGLKNTKYDAPHTISVIRLSGLPRWLQWKMP
jgi:hypothetical protein